MCQLILNLITAKPSFISKQFLRNSDTLGLNNLQGVLKKELKVIKKSLYFMTNCLSCGNIYIWHFNSMKQNFGHPETNRLKKNNPKMTS